MHGVTTASRRPMQRFDAPKPAISLPSLSVRSLFFSGIYGLFFIYLCYHAFNGERGLYALLKENRKLELLEQDLAQVQTQRHNLERDVRLLRTESLDLDMLDEQVRGNLGLAGADEVVVLGTK
jgi:cell division protein FtsB